MILRVMYTRRVNWAAGEINRFHAPARKYYDVDDSDGYFLDVGANIGTTGIYFTTKTAPNLKLLAFEPDAENFKLLRINTILNDGFPTETVKIMPLDAYFAEQKIAAQDVKYVWIDTEGFEPQVILGAKNLLSENPAPVFMECNLRTWDKSAALEPMPALLSEHYSHFVHVQGGDEVYPLDALRTLERPDNPSGQIGDIFLIRKGALD